MYKVQSDSSPIKNFRIIEEAKIPVPIVKVYIFHRNVVKSLMIHSTHFFGSYVQYKSVNMIGDVKISDIKSISKFAYYCIVETQGGDIGWGFCRYDMTTADIDNMKLVRICLASSLILELAKLTHEQ